MAVAKRTAGAPSQAAPSVPVPAPAAAPASRRIYVVAPGRGSFLVPGGSRVAGDEVRPTDFPGGIERIRELVAAGYLVEL